jgi:hypothetical protein
MKCKKWTFLAVVLPLTLLAEEKIPESEKNPEDPTKIITKFGVGYNGDVTFRASVGLDETRKLNFSSNEDLSEWSAGGSWLFPIGIINVYTSGDKDRTSYSIGTFLPLSSFQVDTGKWMVFPMTGFSYTQPGSDVDDEGNKQFDSYGGYLGVFALRPITEQLTFMTWSGGNLGTEDYYSYWLGGGLSYRITKRQSISFTGTLSEDTYAVDNNMGMNYIYEFN